MHIRLFKLINSFLIKKNVVADFSVSKNEVLKLIRTLHPQESGKPLIRMGPVGDGGYLLPDDFENIEACFSPGVGKLSGFEDDCVKRGMKVFMADASVDGPAVDNVNFHFIKKFLGATNNENTITLGDWVSNSIESKDSDLMLQMDIEGWEYVVVPNISDQLMGRFRIIVIEVHGIFRLWNKFYFGIAKSFFEKILQTHVCVHIHPNNAGGQFDYGGINIPKTAEFTFIRKDRIKETKYVSQFPHPLDSDCKPSHKTVVLPAEWYRKS